MSVNRTLTYSYSFEKRIKLAEKITAGRENLKSTTNYLEIYVCAHMHAYTYTLHLKETHTHIEHIWKTNKIVHVISKMKLQQIRQNQQLRNFVC